MGGINRSGSGKTGIYSGSLLISTLHLWRHSTRSEFKNPPSQLSEKRILGPFASSGFDAVDDRDHHHGEPDAHPVQPEHGHESEKLRRRGVAAAGVSGNRGHDNDTKTKNHAQDHQGQIQDLEEESL